MSVSPRIVAIVVISLLVAGLLSLMGLGLAQRAPVTGRSGITRLQKPAPEFTLALLEGSTLTLSEYVGRPVVINFWASWCPPCREEAPVLERTWRSYREKGVLFVGVGIQDTEGDSLAFLREFGISYPSGLDRDGKITVDYGVIGLPVTFFVNRDGIVERRWVGAIGEPRLAAWVEGLVTGMPPSGEVEGENLENFRKLDQR